MAKKTEIPKPKKTEPVIPKKSKKGDPLIVPKKNDKKLPFPGAVPFTKKKSK